MGFKNPDEHLSESSSKFLGNELLEKKTDPKESRLIQQKKMATLASGLIRTLIDPLDSYPRRRYVKRWIYGEGLNSSNDY